MRRFPVYLTAQHVDGVRRSFRLQVEAYDVPQAMDVAFAHYADQFAESEGWTMAAVVDELLAVDVDDEGAATN